MVAAVLLLALTPFVPPLALGDTVPPVPLVDQDGRPFRFADLRGNAVIVSFVSASCTDACPLVGAKLGRIQKKIGDAHIRIVALTLDPRADTPARLRRFGAPFAADAGRWKLATGEPQAVGELTQRLGVDSLAPDGAHDEAAIVLDPDGRIALRIDGNAWTADDVLAAARDRAGAPLDVAARVRLFLAVAGERCGSGVARLSTSGIFTTFVVALAGIGAAFVFTFSTRFP